jgi:hypothetical protein
LVAETFHHSDPGAPAGTGTRPAGIGRFSVAQTGTLPPARGNRVLTKHGLGMGVLALAKRNAPPSLPTSTIPSGATPFGRPIKPARTSR